MLNYSMKKLSLLGIIAGTILGEAAFAQSTFGSITGTVKDPSNAVIPGADIEVTNLGTGAVRHASTASAGVFNVPNLDLGQYQIRISAKGFKTFERTDLALNANQVISIDASLELGTASQVTEVTGSNPVIATETNDISGLLSHSTLEDLPQVGRHAGDQGIYTSVTLNTSMEKVAASSLPIMNGTRSEVGVLPTMDGVAVMAWPQGAGPVQPGMEEIEEVKVESAVAPAEFATAGNIQAVSKAGTNQFHGSAFWEYNGNDLNARTFFSATVPFRVYNDFAASSGGRIVKNKLFYFVDYEGAREAATTTVLENLPLVSWRSGNFGSTNIKDPLTGIPFPGNQIPASRISPVSQNIQAYAFPLPNAGSPNSVTNNFNVNVPSNTGFTHYDGFDARADYYATSKDLIFSRLSWKVLPLTVEGAPVVNSATPLERIQRRYGESAVFSWNHTISPNAVNEFRFGSTYHRNDYSANVVGSSLIQQFGIQGVATTGVKTAPYFNISAITGFNPSTNSFTFQDNPETTLEAIDNLSWTRGRHFMKFGFDFIRDIYGGNNLGATVYGEYDFTASYSGNTYADFLLGLPQTTELQLPPPNRHIRGNVIGMFAQDQLKVNSSLTLNYGLRLQFEPPYDDGRGLIYNYDPVNNALVVPNNALGLVSPFYPNNIIIMTAQQAGYPNPGLINANYAHGIEPRAGFAYKLFHGDKTVIRGGYGIYSNLVYEQLTKALTGGPFSASETNYNAITNGVAALSFPDPFPTGGVAPVQNVTGINPNIKLPYTQQWNLTLERQFGSYALRISYVGTATIDLAYGRNLNEPVPSTTPFTTALYSHQNYNSILYEDAGGVEKYHGLELLGNKRYGKNLTVTAGFTWAKDLTDAQDAGGNGTNYGGQQIQNQFCLACEKANNALVLPHRFFAYAVYYLPVGSGQRFLGSAHGVVQAILGGWRTTWVAVLQSGPYFTPSFSGSDPSNTGVIGGPPDRIPGVPVYPANQSIYEWFNPAAFAVPGCPFSTPMCSNPADVGRFGTSGWNYLQGPPTRNLDFGLSKDFRIADRFTLRIGMNMADAFNHPNFTVPSANISSSGSVGVISGLTAQQAAEPSARQINLNLRMIF
jgi:Carboxypeptidase regulatory-like domain